MTQLILTLIFYLLVVGILAFVYLIWRAGVHERQKLSQTLVDVATKSAETARKLSVILEEREKPP